MICLQNGIMGTYCACRKKERKNLSMQQIFEHSEITPLDTESEGTSADLWGKGVGVNAHVKNMFLRPITFREAFMTASNTESGGGGGAPWDDYTKAKKVAPFTKTCLSS